MLMNMLASALLFLFIGPFKHVSSGETKEAGGKALFVTSQCCLSGRLLAKECSMCCARELLTHRSGNNLSLCKMDVSFFFTVTQFFLIVNCWSLQTWNVNQIISQLINVGLAKQLRVNELSFGTCRFTCRALDCSYRVVSWTDKQRIRQMCELAQRLELDGRP